MPDSVLILGIWVLLLFGLRSRGRIDQIDSLDLLMRRDRVPLQLSVIMRFALLVGIWLDLPSGEAVHFMALHTTLLTCDLGNVLNESNHGLSAIRIEFIVIAGLERLERSCTFLLGRNERIMSDVILKIIPQVRDKSLSIIELDVQSLIINGGPVAGDQLLVASSRRLSFLQTGRVMADHRLDLKVVHQVQFVGVLISETPIMLGVNELDLVRNVVSAELLRLIEVHISLVFGHIEVPLTKELIPDAMNRLISTRAVEQ